MSDDYRPFNDGNGFEGIHVFRVYEPNTGNEHIISVATTNYDLLTIDDIKVVLDNDGIEYGSSLSKSEYVSLAATRTFSQLVN